jgi:hypothetical protein
MSQPSLWERSKSAQSQIIRTPRNTSDAQKSTKIYALKKHSCHNGLKLLPAQFFVLFEQDF